MQSYIASLQTNILGAGGATTQLAPHTFVVAPNGGGKTRITAALGLLVAGTADDVLGKGEAVRSSSELLNLAPFADERLTVEAQFVHADGKQEPMHFRIDGTGGTARHPDEQRPPQVGPWSFPVRLVGRALWSGVKGARDFFLPFMSVASAEDISRKLPDEFRAPIENGGTTPRSIAELQTAITHAGARSREEGEAEKAYTAIVNDEGGALPPEPADVQIEAAQAAVREAQGWVEYVSAYDAQERQRQYLGEQETKLGLMEQALAAAEANRAAQPVPPNPQLLSLRDLAKTLTGVLGQWAGFGNPTCVCCGQPQTGKQLADKLQEMQQIDITLTAQSAEFESALRRWQQTQQQVEEARGLAQRTRGAIEQMRSAMGTPHGAPGVTMEQVRQALTERQGVLTGLLQVRERYVAVRSAREKARAAKRMQGWWKEYAEALKGVVSELLRAGEQGFLQAVQRYLPEEYRLALTLREGNRDLFRVGLERNGSVHYALSGAEKTVVEFALTAACLSLLPEGERPSFAVLCPWEERAVDAKNGARLMRALSELPYQIVLYSIVPPAGKIPKGWAVVDMYPQDAVPKKPRGKKATAQDDASPDDTQGDGLGAASEAGADEAAAVAERVEAQTEAEQAAQAQLIAELRPFLERLGPERRAELFRASGVAEVDSLGNAFGSERYQNASLSLRRLLEAVKVTGEGPTEKLQPDAAPPVVAAAPAPPAADFGALMAAMTTKLQALA